MSALTVDAIVVGDHIRITDDFYKARVARACKRWGDRAPLSVTIEPLKAARTTKQNAQYWGFIVRPVSLFSHMPMNDVHRFFKAELLPAEKFVLSDPNTGEVKLERELERHTTTTLSEVEFDAYMEQARALAMERVGVDLSERGLLELGILTG